MAGVGFSATTTAAGVAASTQIGNWTVTLPYFNDTSFAPATGTFTVPTTGKYSISATISYQTTTALTVNLGPGVDPAFVVRRITPATDLIEGLFPVLNASILAVLTARVILGNGTVTLTGDVELTAGDTVGLFYVANGLTVPLDLGGAGSPIVWSIHQIA